MGSLTFTIPACEGCCGGCPPDGAPTHIAVTVAEDLSFHPACSSTQVDTSLSFSADVDIEDGDWAQSTGFDPNIDFNSCYFHLLVESLNPNYFPFDCPPSDDPDNCDYELQEPVPLDLSFYLVFEGSHWYLWSLATVIGVDPGPGVFCGDISGSDHELFSPTTIDLGTNPLGTHVINLTNSVDTTATVTIVLS